MSTRNRIFRNKRLPSERPLVSIIAALFNNNEQGLWYDIEGFRDSWKNTGGELLTGTWGFSSLISGNSALMNFASTTNGAAAMPVAMTAGKLYKVSFEIVSYTSGAPYIALGQGPIITIASPSSLGFRELLVPAGSVDSYFRIYSGQVGVGGTYSIKNIKLTEWFGLSTCSMFQDSGGTVPVYLPGTGQVDPPVGLMLDRRFGLKRGSERFNDSSVLFSGESTRVSPGVYRCYSSTGTYNLINIGPMSVGSWYELQFTIDSVTNVGSGIVLEGTNSASNTIAWTTTGKKSIIVYASSNYIGFKRSGGAIDYQISNISLKELKGNHAYQTTTTSRPTLSARYNLLTYTDDFSNVVWGSSSNFSVTSGEVAPDGSNTAFKITSVSGAAATSQIVTAHPTGPIKFVIYAKGGTYTNPNILIRNNTTATALISIGIAATSITSTYGSASVTDVGNGWKKVVCNITSGITSGDSIGYYYGATGAVPVGQYWYVWKPDSRQMNDRVNLPEYQRVNSASVYDTEGFPLYLRFDGVDDWMQTANIDLSTYSSLFFSASIEKISDAAVGMLFEFSSGATAGTNNGTFHLAAPNPASSNYSIKLVGSGSSSDAVVQATGFASPIGNIVSAFLDIGGSTIGDEFKVRINGLTPTMIYPNGTTPSGTGNFGNYPLFIGRRAGISLPFKGELYGLFIRAGNIFDSQIVKVEKFFNQKGKVY